MYLYQTYKIAVYCTAFTTTLFRLLPDTQVIRNYVHTYVRMYVLAYNKNKNKNNFVF